MTDPYQPLLEAAADCRQNERYQHVDGCNWCTCIQRGLLICTHETCWSSQQSLTPDQSSEEDFALRQKQAKKEAEIRRQENQELLYDFARTCKRGDHKRKPDGCTLCICLDPGVVRCTGNCKRPNRVPTVTNRLLKKDLSDSEKKNYLEIQRFANTCKEGDRFSKPEGCGVCFCVTQGVVRCTGSNGQNGEPSDESITNRVMKKDLPDSEKIDNLGKASQCQTTDEPIVDGCKKCVCVRTGVMSCRRLPDCKPFDHFPSWVTYGKEQCQDIIDGCKKCVCQPSGGMKCERIPDCNSLDLVTTPMPKDSDIGQAEHEVLNVGPAEDAALADPAAVDEDKFITDSNGEPGFDQDSTTTRKTRDKTTRAYKTSTTRARPKKTTRTYGKRSKTTRSKIYTYKPISKKSTKKSSKNKWW